jgi:hypothetical protein
VKARYRTAGGTRGSLHGFLNVASLHNYSYSSHYFEWIRSGFESIKHLANFVGYYATGLTADSNSTF